MQSGQVKLTSLLQNTASETWFIPFLMHNQAGNVVTGEMVEQLILNGADIIKVGIGPGRYYC